MATESSHSPRVFFITGCSTGFGYHLVQEVLDKGEIAIATARKPEGLRFEGANEKNYLPLTLDVTSPTSIRSAFVFALQKFSHIDIVVNNAGYGLSGPFETLSDSQIRAQMEVNFFGVMNVTRAAMEIFRSQTGQDSSSRRGGLVMQITSIGGQRGIPTLSIYCASKWAVEGFTESLSNEVKPEWGIRFCCVEPGGFRTDWAGRSMAFGEVENEAYAHVDARKSMGKRNGRQVGEPRRGANAMYKLAVMEGEERPLRCVLGSDALGAMEGKVKAYGEGIKRWDGLSRSTDVDEEDKF